MSEAKKPKSPVNEWLENKLYRGPALPGVSFDDWMALQDAKPREAEECDCLCHSFQGQGGPVGVKGGVKPRGGPLTIKNGVASHRGAPCCVYCVSCGRRVAVEVYRDHVKRCGKNTGRAALPSEFGSSGSQQISRAEDSGQRDRRD